MVCPKCEKEIPDDSAFCEYCGENVGGNTIICENCGTKVPADSLFCQKCGVSIHSEKKVIENKQGEDNYRTNTNRTIAFIGGVILLLVLAFILFQRTNSETSSGANTAGNNEGDEVASTELQTELYAGNSDSLEIVESGYSYVERDVSHVNEGEPYVTYGARYKNKEKEDLFGFLQIKVTCKDSDGTIISSQEDTDMVYIPAGEEACLGGFSMGVSKKPSNVTIGISLKPMYIDTNITPLKVNNSRIEGEGDQKRIIGELNNDSGKNLDYAVISCIFRNDKGEIVAGDKVETHVVTQGENAFDGFLFSAWPIDAEISECTAYGATSADGQ